MFVCEFKNLCIVVSIESLSIILDLWLLETRFVCQYLSEWIPNDLKFLSDLKIV